MREHLDCAVLATPFTAARLKRLPGSHLGGRLVIQTLEAGNDVRALCDAAMSLRRFDVLLLAVCPANLAWIRTSLQWARGKVGTPIMALAHELRAPALNDLFSLGVGDFLRDPCCFEELRARCQHLLVRQNGFMAEAVTGAPASVLTANHAYLPPSVSGLQASAVNESTTLRDELESYAMAAAANVGQTGSSLRLAKSKVVERFETAYIKAALHKHEGNIAMAARSAQKHRRAFWALMRKYEIDPAPYRAGVHPKTPHAGKMPANHTEG